MILLDLVLEVYTSCYSILGTRVLRHCRDLLILMIWTPVSDRNIPHPTGYLLKVHLQGQTPTKGDPWTLHCTVFFWIVRMTQSWGKHLQNSSTWRNDEEKHWEKRASLMVKEKFACNRSNIVEEKNLPKTKQVCHCYPTMSQSRNTTISTIFSKDHKPLKSMSFLHGL